ncbi:GntR family transcriptional regulator [Terracidiphilus gabretensis]|uniref:GntR family transcriptional regulator n=1 Tax=Terracidiphilus gabretensis TaxID=1577687 RepID=UPI00071B5F52|nr:GntR family transcriptional regulator [Terracidiphilus gabretensis]
MTAVRTHPTLPLHRGNGLPLYQQIQQRLAHQIQSGVYKPSEPLPSIQKIAAQMGVSQMTVRQAVKSLSELGLIYSRQGKGTYISGVKLEKEFRHVLSFSEEARAHGATPHSRLISFKMQKPTPETHAALGLGEDEKVFRLHRVRYEDSMPIGIECSCLAESMCPDLLETFDPDTSLYEKLASRYGIQLTITEEVIEVGKANAEEARLLKVPRQSPVFLFTRLSFGEDGRPVEHVKSTYRGDRYKIVNRLMRTKRAVMSSPNGM